MRVAVIQSNYIPWRGYFDVINDVDLFVFYDDVQYTINDWRNRNKVKTANGVVWLTIPVGNQNDRRICDVEIRDHTWARKHWLTIEQSYRRTPGFAEYGSTFKALYERQWSSLSELNQTFIRMIARDILGSETQMVDVRDFTLEGARADRLLQLLKQVGATEYVSGPSARAYLDADYYLREGIRVHWMDYSSYPSYPQLHGPFEPGLSVVDLLMNAGTRATDYIWGHRRVSV